MCFLLKSLTIAEGGQSCTDLILQTIVGLLLRTRPCLYFKLHMLTLGSTDIQRQECLYCFFLEPGRRGVPTVKAKERAAVSSLQVLGPWRGRSDLRQKIAFTCAHQGSFLVGAVPSILLCAAFQTAFSVRRPALSCLEEAGGPRYQASIQTWWRWRRGWGVRGRGVSR